MTAHPNVSGRIGTPPKGMQWMRSARTTARMLVAVAAAVTALAGALVLPTAAQHKRASPLTLPAQNVPSKTFQAPTLPAQRMRIKPLQAPTPQRALKASPRAGSSLSPGNRSLIKTPKAKAVFTCRSATGAPTSCSNLPNIRKLRQYVLSKVKAGAGRLQFTCSRKKCTCDPGPDCVDLELTGLCDAWYCNGDICTCWRGM